MNQVAAVSATNNNNNNKKAIIGCCYKNRTICFKNCDQKIVHKAPETEGEFIGNKITDQVLKPKPMPHENARNVEDFSSYSTEKKR